MQFGGMVAHQGGGSTAGRGAVVRYDRTPEGGCTYGGGDVAPPTPLLVMTDHLLEGVHQ